MSWLKLLLFYARDINYCTWSLKIKISNIYYLVIKMYIYILYFHEICNQTYQQKYLNQIGKYMILKRIALNFISKNKYNDIKYNIILPPKIK